MIINKSLSGQTAVITGANSGIGLQTAKALAKEHFELILMVRTEQKAQDAMTAILSEEPATRISYVLADLEDLVSVKRAADEIKMTNTKIDRLINNAGYSPSGISFTADGYERSFIANHMGPFVLTLNLLPLLKNSPDARVINLSSDAHAIGKVSRMFSKNNGAVSDIAAYADGKLANILFTQGLAKQVAGTSVTTYSVHPGVVRTNFGWDMKGWLKIVFALMRPFMITPEKGAATSIYLATTDLKNIKSHSGGYFTKSKPAATKSKDITPQNVNLIWQKSLEVAGSNI